MKAQQKIKVFATLYDLNVTGEEWSEDNFTINVYDTLELAQKAQRQGEKIKELEVSEKTYNELKNGFFPALCNGKLIAEEF